MFKNRKNSVDLFVAELRRFSAYICSLYQGVYEINYCEKACISTQFVGEKCNKEESYESVYRKKYKKAGILVSALLFVLTFELPTYAITAESTSTDVINTVSIDLDTLDTELYVSDDEMFQYEKTEVDQNATSLSRLPEVYKVSINMLDQGEQDKISSIALLIEKLLEEGKKNEASRLIGSALGRERKNSLTYLGWYCTHILHYIDGGLEEAVKYLGGFVRGYGKTGVLILTDEGIKKINVFGRKRGTQWRIVPEGSLPADKFDRIYKGQTATFIPFAVGEIFTVDVYGKAKGTVKMWKIHPSGTNVKSWQGGSWEREVTVRGDKIY